VQTDVLAPTRQRVIPRSTRALNAALFPFRALAVQQNDHGPVHSLRSERFSYVAEFTVGRCLDVGCGPENRFIRKWHNDGLGIDVFGYSGLEQTQIVEDMTQLPFDDAAFDTVTLIAALNHIEEHLRAPQLAEINRVLRPGGRVVLTMGAAAAELVVHKLVHVYHARLGTGHEDMDGERGMCEHESFSVSPAEIQSLLNDAGFPTVHRTRFASQWGLNSVYVGVK
jgi:SAM-dependent methyltransferase